MEIKLDIPKRYKPEITEQEDGYLLRFFEPKEEPKFKREDILRVPESIIIFKRKHDVPSAGDGLLIGFNESKQALGYDTVGQMYAVISGRCLKRVQCELIPCKREDLKVGDTAFSHLVNHASELAGYCKILDSSKEAYISDNCSVMVANWSVHPSLQWYKVVPIKE